MITTFIIGKSDLGSFSSKISSINTCLRDTGFSLKIEETKDTMFRTSSRSYIEAFKILVKNPSIVNKEGFCFIGFAELNKESNLWDTFKIDDNINFEVANNKCDHCNSIRFRNFYYFFKKDDKIIKIGSSCIEDFLGFPIKKALEAWFSLFKNNILIKKELRKSSYNDEYFAIEDIYEACLENTNEWTTWDKGSTSKKILNYIKNSEKPNKSLTIFDIKKGLELTDNFYKNHPNDFSEKVLNILHKDNGFRRFYRRKDLGLISYAIFNSHKMKLITASDDSEWIGKIGDKITVEGDLFLIKEESNPYTYYNYTSQMLYYYELITSNNIHFKIRTSKNIENLTENNFNSVKAIVSGVIGYQGKNNFYKYNSLKGRTKITLI